MPAMNYEKIAHLYDSYVQTDLDLPFFLNEAKNCKNVLELMSGTGRLSIPLLEAGISLTCVDNSPQMLKILRQKIQQKHLSAKVYEMDVCQLSLPEYFDLIILPFNSFSEIINPEQQNQALGKIWNCLSETGKFICTLHNPPIRLQSINNQLNFRGKYQLPKNKETLFLWSIEKYNPENNIVTGTQFYEIYDSSQVMREKSFLDIEFFLHEKAAFEQLLQAQNFSVISLYGDYSFSDFEAEKSAFMIWVLGKK